MVKRQGSKAVGRSASCTFVSLLGLGVRREPHPFFRLFVVNAAELLVLRPLPDSNTILICIKK
jgi:hypothetical protein